MTKQASAVMWAAGVPPELWVDGVKNVLASPPGNPAGTLSISDTLELGRGNRPAVTPNIDYFKGSCSFLGLSSRRQPTDVLATITGAFADPLSCYGHGTVNRKADAIASPVALPSFITGSPGVASPAVDVAAASYDPGGLALTVTAAAVVSGNGTLSRTGTNVTITPASSTVAGDQVRADFTLRNSSLKTSSGRIYCSVVTATTTVPRLQPNSVILNHANWRAVGFTQADAKSSHNSGNLRDDFVAACAVASGGDVLVLADGTYSGSLVTCSRSGAASADGSNHIMVRARTHGMAIINLQLDITGSYWWFTGIKFTYHGIANPYYKSNPAGQAVQNKAPGLWITNSRFTGYAFIRIVPSAAMTNLRFCYNTINASTLADGTDTGIFITVYPTNEPNRAPPDTEIAWNRVTLGIAPSLAAVSRPVLICHETHSTAADQTQFITRTFRLHHNHCVGPFAEMIYCKRNICIEFNYFKWLSGHKASYWGVLLRHGILTNNPQYDSGGIVRGNLLYSDAKPVVIDVAGAGVCVTNNRFEGSESARIIVGAGNGSGDFDVEYTPNRDGCDNLQIVENFNFGSAVVVTPGNGNAGIVHGETAAHRNGWPSNVRLYRGDTTVNLTYSRPADGAGNVAPVPDVRDGYGTGMAAKCGTITENDLLTAIPPVGCDTIA